MDLLKTLLEQSPIMALFLAIAVGYALGEISIKGLSFGVGAFLFVSHAIGSFAPNLSLRFDSCYQQACHIL